MYKLGVIGGMGPMATAMFFRQIVESTDAKSDQEHIDTVILNHSTMPDRTTVILENLDRKKVIDAVKKDIDILEHIGVKNIAIPCNTFHYFYDDVASLTDINIIHMPKETLAKFKEDYGTRVAILSTTGTKKAGVYESIAKDMGMEVINVEDYSEDINNIIYYVKKTNDLKNEKFEDIVRKIQKRFDPDGYILACTELSIIDDSNLQDLNILDAMDVLVKKSIKLSGYDYR